MRWAAATAKPSQRTLRPRCAPPRSWTVSMDALVRPLERPRFGLGIRMPDPLRPPPPTVILQEAFRSAGLAFTVAVGAAAPNFEVLVTERIPE
jgi:hypothetical protein